MLTELRIQGLGVIDETALELGPGLTALTGETGAGKTMIVTSLGLLLGERAEAAAVRRGVRRSVVEGRFTPGSGTAEAVSAVGGELDDGELLVARHISRTASGEARSRALVGGVQASAARLAEITGELATIHGQSEQLRLSGPHRQREVLDAFCGAEHLATLTEYRRVFAARQRLLAQRDELIRDAQSRAREADLLRFGLGEIDAAEPVSGEDAELLAESQRLQAHDDVRALLTEAIGALSGSDDPGSDGEGALQLVNRAGKALAAATRLDDAVGELLASLRDLVPGLSEVASGASSRLADLDADPGRLEWIMERRATLAGLTRKYGTTIDEVLEWADHARVRLPEVEGDDDRVESLSAQIAVLGDQLAALAEQVSAGRRRGAGELAERVAAELVPLGMPHARLLVDIEPLAQLGAHGAERIALLFSANPGAEPAPLGKVASGGELSRVRLALEVVLAEGGHTFVFDEVDAGVGGAIALQVGRRLAELAQHSQVIVVTHLAQVAAFADHHVVVRKSTDGEVTNSGLTIVEGDERLGELARMMAGLDASEASLAHARALLDSARGD